MREDDPLAGQPAPGPHSGVGDWQEQPWVPSERVWVDAPPAPLGAVFAPGPDVTPTRVLPGGIPSWAAPLPASPPSAAPGGAPGGRARRPGGVSRRGVLIGAGVGALGLSALGAGLGFWLTRQAEPVTVDQLAGAGRIFHLLRRAGFGARPGEMGEYLGLGVSGAIDRLLDLASASDDLDARLARLTFDFTRPADLQRWFLLRMIYTRRPLEEKMTLFWHGLLTSSFRKIGGRRNVPLLQQQDKLLRAHALGRFDDLVRAITIDPAMMWWLDLRVNRAGAPNENYARELMELFTTGIGHYTQDDVVAGARALTGWMVRPAGGVQFVPRRFDNGSKTFLGQTGNLGLDDVVRLVCARPATAQHLAWRLWTFFAYENPSDADLQPLVNAYTQQDHSIGAMMRALLTSPQFFSPQAYRARLKSPAEFVVGAIRALELPTAGQGLAPLLAIMGQSLFDPPNVAGWDGDKVSSAWISTQAWMMRLNFVNLLLASASGIGGRGGQTGQDAAAALQSSALQKLIDTWQLATPQALVDYCVDVLLDNQLAPDRRTAVARYLTQSVATPGPQLVLHGGAHVSAAAVRGALYLLMSLPEYQLN